MLWPAMGRRGRWGWLRTLAVVAAVTVVSKAVVAVVPAVAEGSEIRTFGDVDGTSFRFVDHGKTISIYAVRVGADFILDELQAVGGPTYGSLEPLTRPVTLTLHEVPVEMMMRRMLDGYNYTLQYKDGRLSHVRVMHMIPGRNYKVVDPIESLAEWTRRETDSTANEGVVVENAQRGHQADDGGDGREGGQRRKDERGRGAGGATDGAGRAGSTP